jgi:hypothetical protein
MKKKIFIGAAALSVLVVGVLAIVGVGIAAIGADAATVHACSGANLSVSVGQADGTAGTTYYPLVFVNTGSATCSVSGWAQVAFARNANWSGLLARKAVAINHGVKGYGGPVVLRRAAAASVALGVAETGNWSKAACGPVTARSVRVTFEGKVYWVEKTLSVCTKISSSTISGVVAGRTGIS